jgi:hypothetical protein
VRRLSYIICIKDGQQNRINECNSSTKRKKIESVETTQRHRKHF